MNIQDQVIGALCIWRENRGGGEVGMHSVFNVLMNRAKKRNTDVYTEATRRLQFSSMTASGDPELILFPTRKDVPGWEMWETAIDIASKASLGMLDEITNGADLYYAPHGLTPDEVSPNPYILPDGTVIPWVKGWNQSAVVYLCTIQKQVFFKEK